MGGNHYGGFLSWPPFTSPMEQIVDLCDVLFEQKVLVKTTKMDT